MRYKMIAIDLDGTLLGRRGRASQANLQALARAQDAGVMVVPCTGRAWRESQAVLAKLTTSGPGVFVTGAVVGDIQTGQSLDMAAIEPNLAMELVRYLENQPEAVLVCRESQLCGHDYLVTGQGSLSPNTQWWFEATGATVHFQKNLTPDDLHHTLRVGIVADSDRVPPVCRQIESAFADRVLTHSFPAVQLPDPSRSVHVLEVFAAGVDKWRGLQWIARERGIEPHQIAAIGDQINDVAMIQNAGCGVAMANAIEPVKAVADYVTLDCEQDGVAHAIDQLLAQRWE